MLPRTPQVIAVSAAVALLAAACAPSAATESEAGQAEELRLGYFANVTHAPALVGVAEGLIAAELGDTELTTQVLAAGPAAVEALHAGALDAAYLGPNPAINGFIRSDGETLRVVAGAATGGAQLVVRPGIEDVDDLRGARLATPQLGGTQDVALRAWLAEQGLASPLRGGGDVTITPTDNAQAFQLFTAGDLDGAWVPEPWASRLVLEGGAKVLLDEAELWPDGRFLTTQLVVSTEFLQRHPETVQALVRGHVAAVDRIGADPETAREVVNAEIAEHAGKPLSPEVLARSFEGIEFTVDPLAETLQRLLDDAVAAGTTRPGSLEGIYDLRPLNAVLAARGRPAVSAAGLGEQ